VFLLTDREPALLPVLGPDLTLAHSQPARKALLDDLRADAGMSWVPQSAWLTKLEVDSAAADLNFDLAVDASGKESPSPVAAGLELHDVGGEGLPPIIWALTAASVAALVMVAVWLKRPQATQS